MKVLLTMPVYGMTGEYERWERMVDWPDPLPFPQIDASHMLVFPNGDDDEQSTSVTSIEYHPLAEGGHHAVFHCHSVGLRGDRPLVPNTTTKAYMAEHYPGWEQS